MVPTVNIGIEVFALRPGEQVELVDRRPKAGTYLALRLRPCFQPEGMGLKEDDRGRAINEHVLASCKMNADGLWEWCLLSPPTREALLTLMLDHVSPEQRDQWWYAAIEEARPDA